MMKAKHIALGAWLFGWLFGMSCLVQADEAERPHVVLISAEDEYGAAETLPRFAEHLRVSGGYCCTVLQGEGNNIPGLNQLASADALVLYVRRRPLPKEQMDLIRKYFDAGRPLVGLRTSCHAFASFGKTPEGLVAWPEFDQEVLGCKYHGHLKHGVRPTISLAPNAAKHPILAGIAPEEWKTTSSLYYVTPLATGAFPLLIGKADEHVEPVAWTNTYRGSRVFFTSLGTVDDFNNPEFVTMLTNAVRWVLEKPNL